MKNQFRAVSTIMLFSIATAAVAHNAVKNPQVKARMDAMVQISQNLKIIGGMAQGKTQFDSTVAQGALDALTQQAGLVTGLFKAEETDPKSEALPAIWTNWSDFTAKADALGIAADKMDVSTVESLGQGLAAIGGTCKSCHSDYRM